MPDSDYNLLSILLQYWQLIIAIVAIFVGTTATVTYKITREYQQKNKFRTSLGQAPHQTTDGATDSSVGVGIAGSNYAPITIVGTRQYALGSSPVMLPGNLTDLGKFIYETAQDHLFSPEGRDASSFLNSYQKAWDYINQASYITANNFYHMLLDQLEPVLKGNHRDALDQMYQLVSNNPCDRTSRTVFEEVDEILTTVIKLRHKNGAN